MRAGGNRNLVAWAENALRKSELPCDLILREDGKYQGGASVTVSLGLSRRGKGTLRFAPAGAKINSSTYAEIAQNTYLPDCRRLCGVPPECVSQQDGRSSHTANAAQALCKEKFPRFRAKEQWPSNSPDMNPVDFLARGYLQRQVDKKKPACLDTLNVAIKQAVDEMPPDMVQRAAMSLCKRAKLCVEAEGGVFKGKKLLAQPVSNPGEAEEGDEGEEDGEGAAEE